MSEPITYARVIKLAWPASIASLITPILGLTDATVLGYSARPFDVGAVGLAAAIFSLAYWTFGFLRMSTAGLTAQAVGAGHEAKARRILAQSVGFGGALGLVLMLLQAPFGDLSFWLMTRGATVEAETIAAAEAYYNMRIWGAPVVLMTAGMLGWLTARGRTDLLMAIVVIMTFLNMGLDMLFVLKFDWAAKGIAAGTLIAEVTGAALAGLAILFVLKGNDGIKAHWCGIDYLSRRSMRRLAAVNVDIFIRTFILSLAYVYFVQQSGVFGDLTLSANQLLLQFFLVTGLALDGPAIAAETFVGQSLGAAKEEVRRDRFNEATRKTCIVGGMGALILSAFYVVFGDILINLTAPDPGINGAARDYFIWIVVSPIMVAAAFQLDGIYIGATRSQALRNSMIVSGIVYVIAINGFAPSLTNHGLWLAFTAFMLVRALTLILAWPGFALLVLNGLQEEEG